jgi:hypothetical protein
VNKCKEQGARGAIARSSYQGWQRCCKDTVKIEMDNGELVDNGERGTKIFKHNRLAIIAICNLSIGQHRGASS